MQLPRGTLHSSPRSVIISSLLTNSAESQFSGHLHIRVNEKSFLLVYHKGTCILGEAGENKGNAALEEIESLNAEQCDAELYTYTEAQIKLCFEFNKPYIVTERKKEPEKEPEIIPVTEKRSEREHSHLEQRGGTDRKSKEKVPQKKPTGPFQLPRGTFHSIKKSIPFRQCMSEIEDNEFTGYSTITFSDRATSILFKDGLCLMVDFPPLYGSEAADELKGMMDEIVSAELYSLNPSQMKLVIEFNEGYWANDWMKSAGVKICPIQTEGEEKTEDAVVPTPTPTPTPEPASPATQVTTPEISVTADAGKVSSDEEELDDFEEQVKTLQSMDMEKMAIRIKENFKDVVKKLDLGHLIENRENDEKDD